VLLIDEQATPGGSLLAEPGGTARAAALATAATAAGAALLSDAAAIAFYPEDPGGDGRPGVLAVATPQRLLRVSARRFLYATGGYDQNLVFADNDRPGIISARACGRLVFHHGVRPVAGDKRVVVLAGTPYALRLAAGLQAAGITVEVVDLRREWVVGARGVQAVRGLDLEPLASTDAGVNATSPRTVRGDLVAVDVLPAPASELPRQHGARVVLDPARGGFAVIVDEQGRCAPGIFACGDVTGRRDPDGLDGALDAGRAAGQSIAAEL
jgi:sarcosine oxidase subunit alpha